MEFKGSEFCKIIRSSAGKSILGHAHMSQNWIFQNSNPHSPRWDSHICIDIYIYVCVGFHKWGVPPNGWFIMENTIKMDDLGVPHFRKPPYVCLAACLAHFWCWVPYRGPSSSQFRPFAPTHPVTEWPSGIMIWCVGMETRKHAPSASSHGICSCWMRKVKGNETFTLHGSCFMRVQPNRHGAETMWPLMLLATPN